MAKIRIYTLAKETGIPADDILAAVRKMGVEVKSNLSGIDPEVAEIPHIWQGNKGEKSTKVRVYDKPAKRSLDRETTERTIAFINKNAKAKGEGLKLSTQAARFRGDSLTFLGIVTSVR